MPVKEISVDYALMDKLIQNAALIGRDWTWEECHSEWQDGIVYAVVLQDSVIVCEIYAEQKPTYFGQGTTHFSCVIERCVNPGSRLEPPDYAAEVIIDTPYFSRLVEALLHRVISEVVKNFWETY